MSRWRDDLPSDVRLVLEDGQVIEPIPAATRARALARARAVLCAGPRFAGDVKPSRAVHKIGWAAAAGLLLSAAVGAAAAAAYEIRFHDTPAAGDVPEAPRPGPMAPALRSVDEPRPIPAPLPSRSDDAREERALLKRAYAAVARHDFAAALASLSEHARRFRDGRLTEEREALRVRALSASGRTEEARQTARQFEARFPRSPLLSAVMKLASPPP